MASQESKEEIVRIAGIVMPVIKCRCLELLNRDGIPPLREFARERGLTDPFECKPGSRPLADAGQYQTITNAAALA